MSDDLDALAGEYVVGTLDRTERSAFAARIGSDPQARSAVEAWQRRLAGLALLDNDVTPDPASWAAIVTALRPSTQRMTSPFAQAIAPDLLLGSLVASRARWRAAALVSTVLAVAALASTVLAVLRPEAGEHRILVAAVNRGGDKPALLIRVDVSTRRVVVRPVAAAAPEGRSLELWAIGTTAAPRSLGLVGAAQADFAMPSGIASGTTFAVSVEPIGGSKTGGPTGPVIYSGQLVEE